MNTSNPSTYLWLTRTEAAHPNTSPYIYIYPQITDEFPFSCSLFHVLLVEVGRKSLCSVGAPLGSHFILT